MARNKLSRFGRLHGNIKLLDYLRDIPSRRQKFLIKGADREILEAFSEICLNLVKRNVHLTPQQIQKLLPYEEDIYQLSLKRHSLSKKKQIIQKGGFLGALLGTVLPTLISTVIAATTSQR